ncbi:MAG TPA: sulfatase-like hydrolase/transferase [Nitrospirota bacterium]
MPNIIFIQEEAMGRVAIDAPVFVKSGIEVAPFFSSLLKSELLSSKTLYSPTTGGFTCHCEFETLMSCFADNKYGNIYTNHMDHDYKGLVSILKSKGYHCVVFHANYRDFYHRVNAYRRMGFDRYYSKEDFDIKRKVGHGLSDMDFFRQVTGKLKGVPQPYFAFMITLSGHDPFRIPQDLKNGLTKKVNGLHGRLADYLEAINYADRCLETYWRETEHERHNAITVVYGDHQGTSGEEDLKKLGFEIKDGLMAARYMYQIPIVVSAPYLEASFPKRRDMVGDQTDIAPPILDLLGIKCPPYMVGSSLFRSGSTGIGGSSDMIMLDDSRILSLAGDYCVDYKKMKVVEKGGYDDLLQEGKDILDLSDDVIFRRNPYSYTLH